MKKTVLALTTATALGMLTTACNDDSSTTVFYQEDEEVVETDQTGPEFDHTPITEAQIYGQDVLVDAYVTDAEGEVLAVEIEYKSETSTDWRSASMVDMGDGQFVGYIPADAVTGAGMDYYLFAIDDANNESTEPEDGRDDPYHFRVSAD